MKVEAGQLAAVAAVLREGSFEAAARTLHVTPSAVSQRVKQLEEQVGAILVVRGSPCLPTPTGEAVYRHALQVEALERDLLQAVGPEAWEPDTPAPAFAIAVNADSLATWLVPALAAFTSQTGRRVDVSIDDENHTTHWLRSGRVLGAVTAQDRPVQGCRVQPLGVMRYLATASPRFVRRWLGEGCTLAALCDAPSLAYNRKDRLCEQFLAQRFGATNIELAAHYFPSPNACVEASVRGVGWGMNPESLVCALVGRRRLVDLWPGHGVDVPLYWQQWSIRSPSVDDLAQTLLEHGQASLRPAPRR